MFVPVSSSSAVEQVGAENEVQLVELLTASDDDHRVVIVDMKEPMDSTHIHSEIDLSLYFQCRKPCCDGSVVLHVQVPSVGAGSSGKEWQILRQSPQSFFEKSDLFFVCMMRPLSFDIQKQESEIEATQWMPFEEYADATQPFVQKHDLFKYIIDICLAKKDMEYAGFSLVPTTSSFSGKKSCLYLNSRDLNQLPSTL
ncbi:hypothetical protein HHK36_028277 [Tetracentron sinense]|uniref:Nudix hydrolase domain-containing protein n=1 Tax=Tetracentron sinense TaxID=13715 RepID=A0A834YEK5_TETSI|nr:hypothetical protein HHK36_028277 [Tetracentron sinense]